MTYAGSLSPSHTLHDFKRRPGNSSVNCRWRISTFANSEAIRITYTTSGLGTTVVARILGLPCLRMSPKSYRWLLQPPAFKVVRLACTHIAIDVMDMLLCDALALKS